MTEPPSRTLSLAQGRLYIILATLLWSIGGGLTKLLREPTELGLHLPPIDPLVIAAYRVLFAGLVFVPFLRRGDLSFNPWMIFTVVAFALMNGTYISAVALGSAASAILLQNSAPLWMFLVSVFFLGEKATGRDVATLLLGMSGIAIILFGGWSGAQLTPALLALTSGVFYAGILIGLRLLRAESSLWVTILNHLGGAIVLLPLVWHLPTPSLPQLATLAVFGGLQLGLPYYLMARGLTVVSIREAGMLTLLEPLLNPLWAYLVSPETEKLHLATLLGGACILASLLCRYWPTAARPASASE